MRPGELDGGVVAVAGDGVGSCGQADGGDEGDVEAVCGAELLFEAEAHVSESGGESGGGVVVEKVVGDS